MRSHKKHCIMRGAAAESRRSGIKDAWLLGKRSGPPVPIRFLPLVVPIVPDKKSPAHRLMFRGERMKGRHLIVLRHFLGALGGIGLPPARFQKDDMLASFGEPRGKRAAASARTDDDVIAF